MNQIELLKLNVNEHVEKKNGLSYLSWAWAWAEALKADPNATFEVQTFGDKPYMEINGTAMVWVTVTMFSKPMTCFLPVMNGGNRPISIAGEEIQTRRGPVIERIDSFNVNTAIMRCMTKGLALHGLGLYIYAGEDLPEDSHKEEPEPVIIKAVNPERNTIADLEVNTGNASANAQLFADSMIKYSSLVKDLKDLNSYWYANQGQLDKLKIDYFDLYENVRLTFSGIKQSLSKE